VLFEFDTDDALTHVHRWHQTVLESGIAAASVPGAATLYVEAAGRVPAASFAARVIELVTRTPERRPLPEQASVHVVDVTYDGEDLNDVAMLIGVSLEDLITRHTQPTYTVAFLGFSRAFPYLAGLDPRLIVPRLSTPRTLVPAGSVAMGAHFTGIYPAATPGGWRLLGRTSQRFFDERLDPPSVLAIGDRVRFRAVR
jgi:KipI family sensor histidine kinase inhibitor